VVAGRILMIEDDQNISKIVELYLKKENYAVDVEEDGLDGYRRFFEESYDLIILDLMLPTLDGYEICRKIRKNSRVPIIMLTAKGEQEEKIRGLEIGADDYIPKPFDVRDRGLEIGADDYIPKPFDVRELVARIKANLRRRNYDQREEKDQSHLLTYDTLILDTKGFEVSLDGRRKVIPRREVQLLKILMENPNRVFTRDELIENLWGWDFEGEDRVIDVYIKRLRKRLIPMEKSSWNIETVWGIGYKFRYE